MALWLLGQEPEKVQAVAEFSDRGVDTLATAILTFPGGVRALLTSGMVLATEKNHRIDRLEIHGTKGSIKSAVQFNQAGQLSYRVCVDGVETVKTITAPQNYRLEVEQLGRCILEGQQPHVTESFTLANGRVLQAILEKIGY
jgi:predicted dehydrogenase